MLNLKDEHLLDVIDQWADIYPDRIAINTGKNNITWRELIDKSNNLAFWIDMTFKNVKQPIAFYGHKEPEMVIGFLATVKTGRPYIPIDISTPQQRIDNILKKSEAHTLLTPLHIVNILKDNKLKKIDKDQRVKENDAFYIIFTSGSTGEPKGVVITLRNLITFLKWVHNEHDLLSHKQNFLNQAPFSFDLSVMDLYSSLTSGSTLCCLTKLEISDFKKLYERLKDIDATFWVSTPSFAQLCLLEKTFTHKMLPTLQKFWFCGETLTNKLATELLERFPKAEIWNTYGPTEATVATTSIQVTKNILDKYPVLPIGYVMPGTKINIITNINETVGEITITGLNVSSGYLKESKLTETVFKSNSNTHTYLTGDLGYFEDNLLFYSGRKDRQIKLNGFRIELGDLEANIRNLNKIKDVIVLPQIKDTKVTQLIAYVILNNSKIDCIFSESNQIKKELSDILPYYMVPSKIIFYENFPLTDNGKIDYKRLISAKN